MQLTGLFFGIAETVESLVETSISLSIVLFMRKLLRIGGYMRLDLENRMYDFKNIFPADNRF